jgi:uncharacterized protein YeaO (DUF488 family)
MLYLNSIENTEASPTEKKYAICHEEVPSMPNIPELAPSKELLAQWESKEIDWEEFHGQFWTEMRAEYRNGSSRLRGLTEYGLENAVTLHSPEPSGGQTYRAILEEIINLIWENEGRTDRVINLARAAGPKDNTAHRDRQMFAEVIAAKDKETQLLIENAELKARINQLKREINTHKTTINERDRTLSEKKEIISNQKRELQSLKAGNRNKDSENDRLKTQIAQLQEIKTHPELRKVAVKATRDNPVVFGKDFRTLNIDNDLPINLREWLVEALREVLKTNQNSPLDLDDLIWAHTDFNVKYTLSGKFDKYDTPLAHVIRTQRHLIAHPDMMDERTKMARVLCCFFAAALLSPKLSKSDHTSVEATQIDKTETQ